MTSRAGIVPLDVDMSVLHTVNGGSRQSIDAIMALKQPLANPPNLYAFPFYGYTDVPAHGEPLNIDNANPGSFLGGGGIGDLGSPWTLGNVMNLAASAQMGRNNLLRRGFSQPFHWRLGIGAGVAAGIAIDLTHSATAGGTKHIPTLGGIDSAASVVNDDNVKSTDTDDNGNMTGIAYADGTSQAWTYDPAWNQVTSYTNQAGQLITQQIDPDSGLILAITEVVGAEDARSAETDDLTTLFAYTDESDAPLPVGLLRSVTDPEGQVTRIDYDDDPESDSFALANALTYAYGTSEAATTLFGYDAAGNVNSLTDAVGNTTAWVYNAAKQVTQETVTIDAVVYTRSFQYDAEDRLWQSTDRNGRVIEYLFDDQRGERVERWLDGQTIVREIVFDYDDATGQLISVDDTEVDFTYTYQGARLESAAWDFADFEISAGQADVTFDYGYQGAEHAATRVTLGSTSDYQTLFAHDGFGRLIRVEQTSQPGGNAVSPKGVDFTYTPDGLPETISRYADADGDISTSGTKTVASSAYTYDPSLRRLTDLIHAQGATTLSAYTWTYDDTGRIDLFGTPEGTYDYQYDATGQLIDVALEVSQGGGFTDSEHYEYDAAGNRTSTGLTGQEVTYATGDANRMTDAGNYTYTHDPEGNTIARFEDVDSSGDLSTGDTDVTEYEWDHRNRLTRVISRATEGGAATQEVQYTYDYLNRWVAHTVDLDGDGAAAATSEYFVYDGGTPGKAEQPDIESEPGQIVLQLDESGNPTHRHLWGQAVDQILADEIVDDGGAEDVLWTLSDHQNTVRDLAVYDEVLDQTSVVNHIGYDAFGNVLSETNAAVDHLFGYTGRAFDETTGLQNNLHRWYDASVGRWLSEDPIGFGGGDTNLYRAVHNSPANALDPSGLEDLTDAPYLQIENAFGTLAPGFEAAAEAAGEQLGIEGSENAWSELHEIRETFRTAQNNDIIIYYGHAAERDSKIIGLAMHSEGVLWLANILPGAYGAFGVAELYGTSDIVDDIKMNPGCPGLVVLAGCKTQAIANKILANTRTSIVVYSIEKPRGGKAARWVDVFLENLKGGTSVDDAVKKANKETGLKFKTDYKNSKNRRKPLEEVIPLPQGE